MCSNEAFIFALMQTSKYLYWGAQTGGWLVYAMLTTLATYTDNPANIDLRFWVTLALLISSGLLITHFMRYFLLRWDWLKLKFGPLVPRIIGISLAAACLLVLMIRLITFVLEEKSHLVEAGPDKPNALLSIILDILSAALLMILWNAIYFTYHFFRKSINQELYNLQLQASQHEIELKNLRSQLNPHFLFNSLNSIRALIDIEPVKAKKSVTTLSNLLRNSLVSGKNEFIPLHEELQIVGSYLELEKIRFEERLEVVWDLDDSLSDYQIPPFIVQTQAENAIKHGISKIVEGGQIIIRTQNLDDAVRISIENSGRLGKKVDTGIGIENTRRRLDLQYNGLAKFDLAQQGENVICTIEIKK